MKKNNAGISIVELLIVISIIGILTGFGVYSFGQVTGYRARECAKKINTSISANKILTLGKAKSTGNICWELYNDDGDFYVRTVRDADGSEYYEDVEQVSEGRVRVLYTETLGAGGTGLFELSEGTALRFCFNRSTGAICSASAPYWQYNIREIRVIAGNKTYKIKLVPETGKVVQ